MKNICFSILFCCIFALSHSLNGVNSEKELIPDAAIRKDAYTFLTRSGCETHPGFFIHLNLFIMSHSKLITAYEELKDYYGRDFSPNLFKRSIHLIFYQIIELYANTGHEISFDVSNALLELHKLYEFFDELES